MDLCKGNQYFTALVSIRPLIFSKYVDSIQVSYFLKNKKMKKKNSEILNGINKNNCTEMSLLEEYLIQRILFQ